MNNIIPDMYVSDYTTVIRTWKERLFSLPWKPWSSTKSVYSPTAFIVGDKILVSYQTYWKILEDGLENCGAAKEALSKIGK